MFKGFLHWKYSLLKFQTQVVFSITNNVISINGRLWCSKWIIMISIARIYLGSIEWRNSTSIADMCYLDSNTAWYDQSYLNDSLDIKNKWENSTTTILILLPLKVYFNFEDKTNSPLPQENTYFKDENFINFGQDKGHR